MIEKSEELRKIIYTVQELLKADCQTELQQILNNADITITQTDYDNWDGGIYYYTVSLIVDLNDFIKVRDQIEKIETELLSSFEVAVRHYDNELISAIRIIPKVQPRIDWQKVSDLSSKDNLLKDIEYLKITMISVATGGSRIQDVNDEYKDKYKNVNQVLMQLKLPNDNPYKDLWEWYGKWSSEFPHYIERRIYITKMYEDLIRAISESEESEKISITVDLIGWERVERTIHEIKNQHIKAKNEEEFQIVGLLCRELIITLAQTIYIPEKHIMENMKEISKTDAKRMFEAYINTEYQGSSNEVLRKYMRSSVDLANELTHKRTATKKDSAICYNATYSIINIFGILENRY